MFYKYNFINFAHCFSVVKLFLFKQTPYLFAPSVKFLFQLGNF